MSDDEVKITKRQLLEQIRSEQQNGNESSRGYVASGNSGIGEMQKRIEREHSGATAVNEGSARVESTLQGIDSGIRQTNGQGEQPIASDVRSEPSTRERIDDTPKHEVKLTTIPSIRQKKKMEEDIEFKIKNIKDEKKKPEAEEKVFTAKEVSESQEKLTKMYQIGSEFLDGILEVVVKGHESVQIWALSDEEAEMVAVMHLEKAKTSKSAARSARVLIELHDRMYILLLTIPRTKATVSHVKEHGGFSFK